MNNAPSPGTRVLAVLIVLLAYPRLFLEYLVADIRDGRALEDEGEAP